MFVNEILNTMNTELNRIITCLDKLDEEQIWHKYNGKMNAIGNLCVHLAGNEHQHFISGIGKMPMIRQRTLEFTADKTFSKQELKKLLQDTREQSTAILKRLSEEDLKKAVRIEYSAEDWIAMKERDPVDRNNGYERELQLVLFQVCEHYGYHTGQIVLLTKLLSGTDESITGYKH